MAQIQLLPPSPEAVVNFLKQELTLKEVYQTIWKQQIVEMAAAERGVTVTPEEIQAEADEQRHRNRLEKAEDTLKWLADHGVTADDWETGIVNRLRLEKLANHLFAQEAEKYFVQNRLNYEQFLLYQIVVENPSLAQELFYQIEEREIGFYEAANLYDIDESRRHRCGFEGKVSRRDLHPTIAATLLGSNIGEVVGPLEFDQKHHLFLLKEFIPAELTAARSQEIIYQLFNEWLTTELNYILYNQ